MTYALFFDLLVHFLNDNPAIKMCYSWRLALVWMNLLHSTYLILCLLILRCRKINEHDFILCQHLGLWMYLLFEFKYMERNGQFEKSLLNWFFLKGSFFSWTLVLLLKSHVCIKHWGSVEQQGCTSLVLFQYILYLPYRLIFMQILPRAK